MKTLITLLCLAFSLNLSAIGTYTTTDELYVLAPSGLKLRSTPDGDNVLTNVPYGTKVKPLENRNTSTPVKVVDGITGYWAKVSFGGKTGYVFDGYLSFMPAPAAEVKNLLDYCTKAFKKETDKLLTSFSGCFGPDSDDMGSSHVQLFSLNKRRVVYTEYSGYESFQETIVIDNISMEEAFALCQRIYKTEIEEELKMPKQPKDSNDGYAAEYGEIRPEDYKTFRKNKGKCYMLTFEYGCFEELRVTYENNKLCISKGGGC